MPVYRFSAVWKRFDHTIGGERCTHASKRGVFWSNWILTVRDTVLWGSCQVWQFSRATRLALSRKVFTVAAVVTTGDTGAASIVEFPIRTNCSCFICTNAINFTFTWWTDTGLRRWYVSESRLAFRTNSSTQVTFRTPWCQSIASYARTSVEVSSRGTGFA